MEKEYDILVKREIEKICKPIFDKVLKEIPLNRQLVGNEAKKEPDFAFLQLHDYRRYFDYDKVGFKPPTDPRIIRKLGYHTTNYSSQNTFKDYKGCLIVIRKNTIQVTNKIEYKRWYSIDVYRAYEDVREIVEKKERETVSVLRAFLSDFGGFSRFNLINYHQESKVQRTPITDRLDERLTWQTREHKKVYKKKLVEVYDINKAIQLIDNSIVYSNLPEVAEPLHVLAEGVRDTLAKSNPKNAKELKDLIKTKEDLLNYKVYFPYLSDEEKIEMLFYSKKILFGGG